jgi:Fe-S cluster assembly iron-binding protein IscA
MRHRDHPLEEDCVGCGSACAWQQAPAAGDRYSRVAWVMTLARSAQEDCLMLTVTEPARNVLQGLDHPMGTVLRLEPMSGTDKIGLVAGEAAADDQVIEEAGTDLLHVPSALATVLDGSTIDVTETPTGPRLSLQGADRPR